MIGLPAFLLSLVMAIRPLRKVWTDNDRFDRIMWKAWLCLGLVAVGRAVVDEDYVVATGMGGAWTVAFMIALAVANRWDAA